MRKLAQIAAGTMALALLVGVLFSGMHPTAETVLGAASLLPDDIPHLLQRIRGFHRVVTRDGRKLLEISADEASYFRNDRAIRIKSPAVTFFDNGEEVASMEGGEGRLYLDGNDVEAITLEGGVALRVAQFSLRADNIRYHRGNGLIRVDGAAEIDSPELSLSGKDLVVDMAERSLVMKSNVTMQLKKASG